MESERDLYSKKQYLLNIEQKTRIRELVHEFDWKNPLKRVDLDILMTNIIVAECIAGKFYPAEQDENMKKSLLKDMSDLLYVINEDTKLLTNSGALTMLKMRINAIEIFLSNNKKSAA